jgi:hypothetical protein
MDNYGFSTSGPGIRRPHVPTSPPPQPPTDEVEDQDQDTEQGGDDDGPT